MNQIRKCFNSTCEIFNCLCYKNQLPILAKELSRLTADLGRDRSKLFRALSSSRAFLKVWSFFRYLRRKRALIWAAKFSEIRVVNAKCTNCGFPKLLRLRKGDGGVRCPHCLAGTTSMSLISVIEDELPVRSCLSVYELSTRGQLFEYLTSQFDNVVGSEFWPGVPR